MAVKSEPYRMPSYVTWLPYRASRHILQDDIEKILVKPIFSDDLESNLHVSESDIDSRVDKDPHYQM
jgi:hypothetical protein